MNRRPNISPNACKVAQSFRKEFLYPRIKHTDLEYSRAGATLFDLILAISAVVLALASAFSFKSALIVTGGFGVMFIGESIGSPAILRLGAIPTISCVVFAFCDRAAMSRWQKVIAGTVFIFFLIVFHEMFFMAEAVSVDTQRGIELFLRTNR